MTTDAEQEGEKKVDVGGLWEVAAVEVEGFPTRAKRTQRDPKKMKMMPWGGCGEVDCREAGCAKEDLEWTKPQERGDPAVALNVIEKNHSVALRGEDTADYIHVDDGNCLSAADAASLEALRRRARDYANLLDGVEEQKRLRALDTGAEVSEGVKEAIRRSAARSGLVAPDDVDAPFVDLNKERNG